MRQGLASGEEWNDGSAEPSTPRQAATVIVLRGDTGALEVLMVRRNPAQRFMGGAWVFPGGAVEEGEDHRTAAVREVVEEAAIDLGDPAALVPWSRWITPARIKTRFDTHFFLAPAPAAAAPSVDDGECVDWGWFEPSAALAAGERDELNLVFPTIKTLEGLTAFATAAELLAGAAGRTVEPIEPRVVTDGDNPRIVLPGEPGYE